MKEIKRFLIDYGYAIWLGVILSVYDITPWDLKFYVIGVPIIFFVSLSHVLREY